MRLIQYVKRDGRVGVGRIEADEVIALTPFESMYALASHAIAKRSTIEAVVLGCEAADRESYASVLSERRIRAPLTHPDPAHCLITGTGLTHLGSAEARDAMHKKLTGTAELTDSMRLFKLGVEGGRPAAGATGAQPEWFYKGDGAHLVDPQCPLTRPQFALDGGEEPEIVGAYLIGPEGVPYRVGFALGNEFSDHVLERQNYLYLAHSKLRTCSVGPELRTGALPEHLQGFSRIRRAGAVVWEKPFLTGEANMCHTIANLEFHHFKYAAHRRPGDVHLHFFGTATLSFSDGVEVLEGDEFEVELKEFGAPLRNPLRIEREAPPPAPVRAL